MNISRRSLVIGAGATSALALTTRADAATSPTWLTNRDATVAKFGHTRPTYWGPNAPGSITRFSTATTKGRGAVALTFDACGGHVTKYDAALIDVLRRNHVRATLFINRDWATNNRALFAQLLADPLFEIASHGWSHKPLSVVPGRSIYGIAATTSVAEVWGEIAMSNWYLSTQGKAHPRFMRCGTLYADDVAARVAREMGQPLVGCSVIGDAGATFTPSQVDAAVSASKAGDIVLCHMNKPGSGTAAGLARAIPKLRAKGLTFRTLSEVAA